MRYGPKKQHDQERELREELRGDPRYPQMAEETEIKEILLAINHNLRFIRSDLQTPVDEFHRLFLTIL